MTGYEAVQDVVAEAAGFDVEVLGEAAFVRSVDALMARRGIVSPAEYALALRASAEELQSLVEELVVPETWFFRHRGSFEFLGPWARVHGGFLRVLSVPCSTGEEPYSIAITLLEAGLAPERFSIDAVDISPRLLEAAQRAVYGKSCFRETWTGCQDYFTPVEDRFALSPEIVRLVRFHCDNLVRPAFLCDQPPYQVVFCRHLLIYLGTEARRAVLSNVGRLLAPGGILVVGPEELTLFCRSGYTAVSHPHSFACRTAPLESEPASPAPVSALPVRRVAIEEAHARGEARPEAPAEVSLELVRRLADKGAVEQALLVCDRLLAADRTQPEPYYLKALLCEASDRWEAAEDFFRKALYLDPEHYPALLHMGALCDRKGETYRGELFRARAKRVAERGVELK